MRCLLARLESHASLVPMTKISYMETTCIVNGGITVSPKLLSINKNIINQLHERAEKA